MSLPEYFVEECFFPFDECEDTDSVGRFSIVCPVDFCLFSDAPGVAFTGVLFLLPQLP